MQASASHASVRAGLVRPGRGDARFPWSATGCAIVAAPNHGGSVPMLEQMRQRSQSWIIWLFFLVIIIVFIINFGPQSPTSSSPSIDISTTAAKVVGRELSRTDFRYGYLMVGGGQSAPAQARQRRLKEMVMDKLLERELLAAEAEKRGFRVSVEEVEDLVASSKMVMLGYEQPFGAVQKDGRFDYETFRRFVSFQLQMSPKAFLEQQRIELLAAHMRNLLRAGANVGSAEVKEEFQRQGTQINLEYVRFVARRFEDVIDLPATEVEAYAKANEAKLKQLYTDRKYLYEKLPRERRLAQITVKLAADAGAEAEKAAKKKADDLLARLKKGEPFAAVARAGSEDTQSKARGGSLGWRREKGTSLPAAVEAKVWPAKDGELIGPEKAEGGFFIVRVEATREGDISFENVRLELAEEQLRGEKANAKAKAEAEAALAKARAAKDKALKDLFPAPADSLQGDPGVVRAEETGLFARRGHMIEGIGVVPGLAKAAFALKVDEPFAGPFDVPGGHVVVKLKERKEADMVEFEKKKGELQANATAQRGEEILQAWALRRCVEARDAKQIEVNRDVLRYDDSDAQTAYAPCSPPSTRF